MPSMGWIRTSVLLKTATSNCSWAAASTYCWWIPAPCLNSSCCASLSLPQPLLFSALCLCDSANGLKLQSNNVRVLPAAALLLLSDLCLVLDSAWSSVVTHCLLRALPPVSAPPALDSYYPRLLTASAPSDKCTYCDLCQLVAEHISPFLRGGTTVQTIESLGYWHCSGYEKHCHILPECPALCTGVIEAVALTRQSCGRRYGDATRLFDG